MVEPGAEVLIQGCMLQVGSGRSGGIVKWGGGVQQLEGKVAKLLSWREE